MPRGTPKELTALRLDPKLKAAARKVNPNLTAAVEDGLRLLIEQAGRLGKKTPPPTKPKS